jgi:voltage-gated potassium channel
LFEDLTDKRHQTIVPIYVIAGRRTFNQVRHAWLFLQREHLVWLLFLTVIIVMVSTVAISVVEPNMDLVNGLWWSIVTMTTVGYGDISPHSLGGRIIAITIMFLGIGLLGMFSASIASILVQNKLREERGLNTWHFRNHIILCEWNHRTEEILKDLRADPKTADQPIVLIADIPTKPINDDNLHFVAGNVNDDTLQRANLSEAQTVVILGDDRLEPNARDAKVVLATLTIETINRAVYTIVELVSDANVRHCQRASADEIIVNNHITSGLLARAALEHGITKIITDWLRVDHNDELYKVPVPTALFGRSFIDALTLMKKQYGSITLGVQRAGEGDVLSNPPADLHLSANDLLIVVSAERPNVQ